QCCGLRSSHELGNEPHITCHTRCIPPPSRRCGFERNPGHDVAVGSRIQRKRRTAAAVACDDWDIQQQVSQGWVISEWPLKRNSDIKWTSGPGAGGPVES